MSDWAQQRAKDNIDYIRGGSTGVAIDLLAGMLEIARGEGEIEGYNKAIKIIKGETDGRKN
jgi:hypothetical protein